MLLNSCGLTRLPVISCSLIARSTASMLSRSRSSNRFASSVTRFGSISKLPLRTVFSCSNICASVTCRLPDCRCSSRTSLALHQQAKAADRAEIFLHAGVVGFELELVALAQRDAELERVDRIQPQALAEQRRVVRDVLGLYVLERQGLDDKPLDLQLQVAHRIPSSW